MDEFTVADLRREEIVEQIQTVSTFYLPPHVVPTIDPAMKQKLKLDKSPIEHALEVYPRSRWIGPNT